MYGPGDIEGHFGDDRHRRFPPEAPLPVIYFLSLSMEDPVFLGTDFFFFRKNEGVDKGWFFIVSFVLNLSRYNNKQTTHNNNNNNNLPPLTANTTNITNSNTPNP